MSDRFPGTFGARTCALRPFQSSLEPFRVGSRAAPEPPEDNTVHHRPPAPLPLRPVLIGGVSVEHITSQWMAYSTALAQALVTDQQVTQRNQHYHVSEQHADRTRCCGQRRRSQHPAGHRERTRPKVRGCPRGASTGQSISPQSGLTFRSRSQTPSRFTLNQDTWGTQGPQSEKPTLLEGVVRWRARRIPGPAASKVRRRRGPGKSSRRRDACSLRRAIRLPGRGPTRSQVDIIVVRSSIPPAESLSLS